MSRATGSKCGAGPRTESSSSDNVPVPDARSSFLSTTDAANSSGSHWASPMDAILSRSAIPRSSWNIRRTTSQNGGSNIIITGSTVDPGPGRMSQKHALECAGISNQRVNTSFGFLEDMKNGADGGKKYDPYFRLVTLYPQSHHPALALNPVMVQSQHARKGAGPDFAGMLGNILNTLTGGVAGKALEMASMFMSGDQEDNEGLTPEQIQYKLESKRAVLPFGNPFRSNTKVLLPVPQDDIAGFGHHSLQGL